MNVTNKLAILLTLFLTLGISTATAAHVPQIDLQPDYVAEDARDSYTVTVDHTGSSSDDIYRVDINLPSGITVDDTSSVTCPTGWSKDKSTTSKVVCYTDAFSDDALNKADDPIDITFSATSDTYSETTDKTFSIVTTDNEGGNQKNTDKTVTVDVEGPSSDAKITSPTPSDGVTSDSSWTIEAQNINDDASGVKEVELQVNTPNDGWNTIETFTDLSGSETYSYSPTENGVYEFRTKAKDEIGNVEDVSSSGDDSITYDDSEATSVSIDSPSTQEYKKSSGDLSVTYSYSDSNPEQTTVNIGGSSWTFDDTSYAADNSEKTVSVNLDSPDSGTALGEGTYDITIDVSDQAGNTASVSATDQLVIDDTAPTYDSAITGDSVSGNSTANDKITLSFTETGSGLNSGTVETSDFSVSNPDYSVSGTTVGDQEITLTLQSSLANGETPTVELSGGVSDKSGNTLSSGSQASTDGLRPDDPSGVSFEAPSINKNNVGSVNVDVSLDSPESGEVTLKVYDGNSDTDPVVSSKTVNSGSTVTKNFDGLGLSTLDDGTITATAKFSDDAGNLNNGGYGETTASIDKDTTKPTIESASRTDDTTFTFEVSDTGSGLDISTVESSDFNVQDISGESFTGFSGCSDGTNSCTVTVNLDSAVDRSTLTVEFADNGQVSDTEGNRQSSDTVQVSDMDGKAPTVKNEELEDQKDNNGKVKDGDTVRVHAEITDGTGVGTVTADLSDFGASNSVTLESESTANVNWDDDSSNSESNVYGAEVTVDSSSANEGTGKSVTVTATDSSSNSNSVTTSAFGSLENDFTVPTVSYDSPTGVTADNQPVIQASMSDAETGVDTSRIDVTIRDSNTNDGSDFTRSGTGNGVTYDTSSDTLSVDLSSAGVTLADGSVEVEVSAEDVAGNSNSFTNTNAFTVDTESPSVSVDSPSDNTYFQSHQTISGTASDENTVSSVELQIERSSDDHYWTGSSWQSDSTWVTADGTTDWSYDTSAKGITGDDTYTVKARATDGVSNSQESTSVTYTVDTQAPSVSNVGITDAVDQDGIVNDADKVTITADVSDTLSPITSVTGDASDFGAGSDVTLVDDGSGQDSESGDGTYTAQITVSESSDVSKSHSVTVSATDEAGNGGSQKVSSNPLDLDTQIDTASLASLDVTKTSDSTVTVDYNAQDANFKEATISIDNGPDGSLDSATVNAGDSTVDLSIPQNTMDGSYDVTMTVEDNAGNSKTVTKTDAVTVDDEVTSLSISDTTVQPDDTIAVTGQADNTDDISFQVTDGNGDTATVTKTISSTGFDVDIDLGSLSFSGGDEELNDGQATLNAEQANTFSRAEQFTTFTVDDTKPDVSFTSPTGTVTTDSDTIKFSVTDSTAGIDSSTISVTVDDQADDNIELDSVGTGDNHVSYSSDSNTVDVDLSSSTEIDLDDGAVDVSLTVSDKAGKTETLPKNSAFTVDTTAPSIASAETVSTTEVEVTLNDETSKVDVGTISSGDFKVGGSPVDSISGFSSNSGTVTGSLTLDSSNSFNTGATPDVEIVSGISDVPGNTVNSQTFTGTTDGTPLEVSNVELANDGENNLSLAFDTTEKLGSSAGDLSVAVTDPNGNEVYSFDRNDFTESDSYTYTLSVEKKYTTEGQYTADIETAVDSSGVEGNTEGDTDTYTFAPADLSHAEIDNSASTNSKTVVDLTFDNQVTALNSATAGLSNAPGELRFSGGTGTTVQATYYESGSKAVLETGDKPEVSSINKVGDFNKYTSAGADLSTYSEPGKASSCDITVARGESLQTKIGNAGTDDVVCLNDGTYSGITLDGTDGLTIQASGSSKPTIEGINVDGDIEGLTIQDVVLKGSFKADRTINVGNDVDNFRVVDVTFDGENSVSSAIYIHDGDDKDSSTSDGGFIIEGSEFKNYAGSWDLLYTNVPLGYSTMKLLGNDFHDNAGQVELRGDGQGGLDSIVIKNNVFMNSGAEGKAALIVKETPSTTIQSNTFENVGTGDLDDDTLRLKNVASADVENNLLKNNNGGIKVVAGSAGGISFSKNSIVGTSQNELVNEGSATLSANDNWFGMDGIQTSGSVDASYTRDTAENSQSVDVDTFRRALSSGTNMVSFPINQGKLPVTDVTGDLSDENLETVWTYQNGQWKELATGSNEDDYFRGGRGYLFSMNAQETISVNVDHTYDQVVSGDSPSSPVSYNLTANTWNLIGSYEEFDQGTDTALDSLETPAGNNKYSFIDGNSPSDIETGEAYWTLMTGEGGYANTQ